MTSRFDRERNVYVCPTNKLLKTTGNVSADHKVRYRALRVDCRVCPLKSQCSPNTPSRKIERDAHEDAHDHARSFVGTPEFDRSRNERKKVEMRFAHLKRPIIASNVCGYAASPGLAMSSTSPPSCRTSKRLRCES
jgi:hypothetical protein